MFKSTALVALALTALGVMAPQSASAAAKIQPTNVKIDKSCGGSFKTKLITGINLAGKYGKLQATHKVTVFCDHRMKKTDADGTYAPDRNPVYGDKVNINAKTRFAEMVVIHELGHYLDFERYGYDNTPVKVSDKKAAARQAIREADAQTYAVSTWADCMVEDYSKDMRGWCGYQLNDTELFARGYAQYVGIASGNATVLKQIKTYGGGYVMWGYAASQDHADDFTAKNSPTSVRSLYEAYRKL